MSNKLNVPSFNYLIPREHRIRAIQDLYGHVGDSSGTASEEDLAAETAAREDGDKELSSKIDTANTALSDLADNVGDLQNTKADKTDLNTLSTKVDTNTTNIATKANSSDVYTKTQSDGKYATQTTVNTLQSTVDTKASQSDLTALKADVATNTTNIANKASTSDLNALKTSVEGNTASITNLTATVGTKADASDLDNYYTKTEVDTITGDIKSALVTINGEDA